MLLFPLRVGTNRIPTTCAEPKVITPPDIIGISRTHVYRFPTQKKWQNQNQSLCHVSGVVHLPSTPQEMTQSPCPKKTPKNINHTDSLLQPQPYTLHPTYPEHAKTLGTTPQTSPSLLGLQWQLYVFSILLIKLK